MLFVEYWSRLNILFVRLQRVFIASAGVLRVQHVLVNHPLSSCCNSSLVKHRCRARYPKGCLGWLWHKGSTADQRQLLSPQWPACTFAPVLRHWNKPRHGVFFAIPHLSIFLLPFTCAQTTSKHHFQEFLDKRCYRVPILLLKCIL